MIKPFLGRGVCLKCRGCCRFRRKKSAWLPHLLREEAKKLGRDPLVSSFISSKGTIVPKFRREEKTFVCPLLNLKNNRCRIYRKRPFECRLYPFLLNRARNRVFLAADENCPYLRERLNSRKFRDYTIYLLKFLRGKNYSCLIHTYPQVRNLAEIKPGNDA